MNTDDITCCVKICHRKSPFLIQSERHKLPGGVSSGSHFFYFTFYGSRDGLKVLRRGGRTVTSRIKTRSARHRREPINNGVLPPPYIGPPL